MTARDKGIKVLQEISTEELTTDEAGLEWDVTPKDQQADLIAFYDMSM